MRTSIISGLLFSIFSFSAYSQDIFIYGKNGTKEYFERIDSIVQIKFKEGISFNEKLAVAKIINPKLDNVEISEEKHICIPVDKNNPPDYKKLKNNSSLIYANQSLQYSDGAIQIPTEKVLARIKEGYNIDDVLNKLYVEYESFSRIGHNVNSYLIVLKNGESVETANLFYESGYFEHAQPSFTRTQTILNTYYSDQWGLNNTGQYDGTTGIDINAPEAWEITEGCEDIVVAVLDQGVDLDHPDLAGNLLPGYDATDGSDGAVNGDCFGNYAHGTCCAGIIGAIDNSIGTKGIAPNCKIIPIRIMKTNSIADDDDAVEGMNYAWETAGADVISCSWKKSGSPITDLDDEISYALELGRDNLGCVVVFGTGNDNSSVCYPANSNSDIIAVGAISPCGERKNPSSCDGEDWGSNYGTTLDVVAPGVLISTTDIDSSAGYNPNLAIHTLNGGNKITSDYSNQSYTVWFNGTSAATPHVAGVAALILSVNPGLTQDQVRDVIESTCTKVGSYNYTTETGRNNGTWNNHTGYGCINAYASVHAVCPYLTGPSLICSAGTFTVNNLPAGTSVTWSAVPSGMVSINATGDSATLSANTRGTVNLSAEISINGHVITQLTKGILIEGSPYVNYLSSNNLIRSAEDPTCFSVLRNYDNSQYWGTLTVSTSEGTSIQWSKDSGSMEWSSHQNTVTVSSKKTACLSLRCAVTNLCGTTEEYYTFCAGPAIFAISPNPSTGETTVSLGQGSTDEAELKSASLEPAFGDNTEWELEVYDSFQNLKLQESRLKGGSTTLNTQGWPEGIYLVRAKYKDEILTGKLVVK